MIYPVLKVIMRTAVRIFFKEIRFSGLENIPKNKPIIFAANHNSAFMDAIVIAVFIEPQIYFLTRSDVFNTSFKKWILKKMNLLPIYRLQEGADNLHKNEQVFADCYQMLAENKSILIFSEGICIQEKRLQKLKKGTARIAFGAELSKDFKLDLHIVPVGINYNKPSQFRSKLHLRFATPLKLNSYAELFKNDESKATYSFTRDLEKVMEQQIVHLKNKSNDTFYEQIVEIFADEMRQKLNLNLSDADRHFSIQQQIGEVVNEMGAELKEDELALKSNLSAYFKRLKNLEIKDKVVKNFTSLSQVQLVFKLVLLLVALPLHLVSLLFNYLPYKLPVLVAQKTCKHIEFVASVIIGAAAFLFLFNFIIWGIVIGWYIPFLSGKLLAFLLVPFLAYFSLRYYGYYKNVLQEIQAIKHSKELKQLTQKRAELIQLLHLQVGKKLKIRNKIFDPDF